MATPTPEEIETVSHWADKWVTADDSIDYDKTYEQGVKDTLAWIAGTGQSPVDLIED